MPRRLRTGIFYVFVATVAWIATGRAEQIIQDPKELFQQLCSNCHDGDKAARLRDGDFKHGWDDASLTISIRDGYAGTGMPAFGPTLAATDIQKLVVFLHERMAGAVVPDINIPIDPAEIRRS